jgi:cell division protein ZapA
MSDEAAPITVQLLGTDYRIACAEDDRESLLDAADYLNAKMLEIRGSRKLMGAERIAVMAALNICHELLAYRKEVAVLGEYTNGRVQELIDKIETALSKLP